MWKHTILLINIAGINHRNIDRHRTSWGNLPCIGMKLWGPFYHPCWRTEKEKINTVSVLLTLWITSVRTQEHQKALGAQSHWTFNVSKEFPPEFYKKRHVKLFPQYFTHAKIFLHSKSALTLNSSTLKSDGGDINERKIWPYWSTFIQWNVKNLTC